MDYALNNDVAIYYLDYDTKLIHPKLEEQVEKAFLKKLLELNWWNWNEKRLFDNLEALTNGTLELIK